MRAVRLLNLLAVPLLLAGCSTLDEGFGSVSSGVSSVATSVGLGAPSYQPAKTTGLAVSDEPLAAQAGATILAEGGTAADAVSAMFFVMTATYPVAAGLGGGGICLVRDVQGHAREFDFLPHGANAGGDYAVPGAADGFYDLQKTYGTLPWQRDVAPGEAYAATGFPISHALALRLSRTVAIIRADPVLAAEFLDANGSVKPEGTTTSNSALSLTLGNIRLSGSDGFYTGPVAAALIAGSGGKISADELTAYHSTQSAARAVNLGTVTAIVPGPSTGAGAFAASLLNNAGRAGDPEARVVAALRQSLVDFHIQTVPPDLGATNFAALDANGQAVACAMTMNGPFGTGRVAADSGVSLAASPSSPAGLAGAFLTPLIVVANSGQLLLSGGGSGGPNGSAAIMYGALRLAAGQPVARRNDLRSTGYAPFATANAIACGNGLCVALPDPGGFGLGATAPEQPVARN